MTPGEFITKWKAAELKERSAAQSHFNDLCRMLDEPSPTDADPTGEWYCFEKRATKSTGGEGWADVWKRDHFERPTWLANIHRDLDAAVASAYGWPGDISEDDALAALLEFNRDRGR